MSIFSLNRHQKGAKCILPRCPEQWEGCKNTVSGTVPTVREDITTQKCRWKVNRGYWIDISKRSQAAWGRKCSWTGKPLGAFLLDNIFDIVESHLKLGKMSYFSGYIVYHQPGSRILNLGKCVTIWHEKVFGRKDNVGLCMEEMRGGTSSEMWTGRTFSHRFWPVSAEGGRVAFSKQWNHQRIGKYKSKAYWISVGGAFHNKVGTFTRTETP